MRIKTIRFRQSGGFAGLVRGSEASGKDITAAELGALERHLRRSRKAPPAGTSPARDLVVYEIEVDTDEGPMRLEFDEANVPKDMAPLMEKLTRRAKPVPP